MQIISRNTSQDGFGRLYLGIVLVILGLMWLGNNFALIPYAWFSYMFSWQMLLLVIGGYLLSCRRWIVGGVVSAVALCYILVDLINIEIPFTKVILPVVVILLGVGLVVREIVNSRH